MGPPFRIGAKLLKPLYQRIKIQQPTRPQVNVNTHVHRIQSGISSYRYHLLCTSQIVSQKLVLDSTRMSARCSSSQIPSADPDRSFDDQESSTDSNNLSSSHSVPEDPAGAPPILAANESTLPALTAAEFRAYNRLAVTMDQYHNHFRSSWTELITSLRTSRPKNQSLRQFLNIALGFCRMLGTHHNIEETYVFPILAKKMPAFQKHNKEHGEMVKHHRQIHQGLDKFEDYVRAVQAKEKDFVASEMLELMESFEKVLWQHLDEEVQQLGALNMRKYWSLEELKSLPM